MAEQYRWDYSLFADTENSFRTGPYDGADAGVWSAADAMKFIDITLPGAQKRRTRPRQDRTGTRSQTLAMVHGSFDPVEVSFTRSIANSGTNTTPPDTTALMTAAFGQETVGGSDVTYSISENPTDSVALMAADASAKAAHQFFGCAVTEYAMNVTAEGEPTESFSLESAMYSHIAECTLTASDGSTTTVTIPSNANLVSNPYGVVLVVESEHILTSTDPDDYSVSGGVGTFTNVTRAHNGTTGAAHSAATCNVLVPSETTAGSPVGEHDITVTLHGTAYVVLAADITFQTGRRLRAAEVGLDHRSGVINAPLSVSANMTLIQDTGTDQHLQGISTNEDTGTLVFAIGSTAGSIYTATLAATEVANVTTDIQGTDDPVEVSLEIMGFGSSGNDDFSVVTS